MKRLMALVLLVATVMVAPSTAGARDMNGSFGIGAQRTLAGVSGFDVVYWIGKMALNATISIYYFNESSSGAEGDGNSGINLGLAAGALFPFLTSDRFDLSIGGRIDISTRDGGCSQLGLEAPLRLEWFVTDHFAIHGEVGVVIELIPSEGRNITPSGLPGVPAGKGTGFYAGNTGLTGGAGFNFIF